MSKKIKDPDVAAGIAAFNSWRTEHGIPAGEAWNALPNRERSKIWRDYQRERWSFDHYFGDDCLGDDGPGHVERLLHDLHHDGTFDLRIPWRTTRRPEAAR